MGLYLFIRVFLVYRGYTCKTYLYKLYEDRANSTAHLLIALLAELASSLFFFRVRDLLMYIKKRKKRKKGGLSRDLNCHGLVQAD